MSLLLNSWIHRFCLKWITPPLLLVVLRKINDVWLTSNLLTLDLHLKNINIIFKWRYSSYTFRICRFSDICVTCTVKVFERCFHWMRKWYEQTTKMSNMKPIFNNFSIIRGAIWKVGKKSKMTLPSIPLLFIMRKRNAILQLKSLRMINK